MSLPCISTERTLEPLPCYCTSAKGNHGPITVFRILQLNCAGILIGRSVSHFLDLKQVCLWPEDGTCQYLINTMGLYLRTTWLGILSFLQKCLHYALGRMQRKKSTEILYNVKQRLMTLVISLSGWLWNTSRIKTALVVGHLWNLSQNEISLVSDWLVLTCPLVPISIISEEV